MSKSKFSSTMVMSYDVEDIEEIGIVDNEDMEWINGVVNSSALNQDILEKVKKISI